MTGALAALALEEPPPTVQAVHRANGARIRALVNRAIEANGITHEELADETQYDQKQIGRALRADGAHPPFALVACVLHRDRLGILVSGLCDLCGREAVVRKVDHVAENKALRAQLHVIRDDLDRLLGGGA